MDDDRVRSGAHAQIDAADAFLLVSFNGNEVRFAFRDGTAAENLAIDGFLTACLAVRRLGVIAELTATLEEQA